jgi:hypothetical protein
MRNFLIIIFLCFLTNILYSQTYESIPTIHFEKDFCLLTGINYSSNFFIDLGVSVVKSGTAGHHPFASVAFIASEFRFVNKPIVGPKIGVWAAGGFAPLVLGLNIIYYSDFTRNSLVLRPEAGLGLNKLKLVYGYNFRLTNTSFDRISRNNFGIIYCFKLKALS